MDATSNTDLRIKRHPPKDGVYQIRVSKYVSTFHVRSFECVVEKTASSDLACIHTDLHVITFIERLLQLTNAFIISPIYSPVQSLTQDFLLSRLHYHLIHRGVFVPLLYQYLDSAEDKDIREIHHESYYYQQSRTHFVNKLTAW